MTAPTYVSQNNSLEPVRMATGEFTTADTTTATLTLGFKPRFINVIDQTTQESYMWLETMAAVDILQRIDAGDAAMDTTQVITASDRSFTFVPKASKTYSWVAMG